MKDSEVVNAMKAKYGRKRKGEGSTGSEEIKKAGRSTGAAGTLLDVSK